MRYFHCNNFGHTSKSPFCKEKVNSVEDTCRRGSYPKIDESKKFKVSEESKHLLTINTPNRSI